MSSPAVILTFDDTVSSQAHFVAPLLKELGWKATFFITFFGEGWMDKHGDTLFSTSEMRELADLGFELGNHTFNHAMPQDADALTRQITTLEDFFAVNGLPPATSFAYPGGPYNAAAAEILKERGYHCARSVRHTPWKKESDDPFNLPAYALCEDEPERFEDALQQLRQGESIILCYHGVPDRVHPWVNVEPDTFREQMRKIAEITNDVRALNGAY